MRRKIFAIFMCFFLIGSVVLVTPISVKAQNDNSTNEVTINEIQSNTEDGGASSYAVTTSGTVVAVDDNGFYLQDGKGAWNGIWVYTSDTPSVSTGDQAEVKGPIDEYYQMTEINGPESVTVKGSGTVPEPVVLDTGEVSQEKYEGVLVEVKDTKVTEPNAGHGEWYIDDGSGEILISGSPLGDPSSPTKEGQEVTLLRGPVDFSYEEFRIRPMKIRGLSISFPKRQDLGESINYPDLPKVEDFRVFLLEDEVDISGTSTGVDLSFETSEANNVSVKYGVYEPDSGPQLPEYTESKELNYDSAKTNHEVSLDLDQFEISDDTTVQYRVFVDGIPYGGRFRVSPGSNYTVVPFVEEGPFVDLVTKDSAVISWETNVPTTGKVEIRNEVYGNDEPKKRHEVKVTGLDADKDYGYQVRISDPESDYEMTTKEYQFGTESSDDEFKFAFMGDSRGGYEGSTHTEGLVNYGNAANYETMTQLMSNAYEEDIDFTVFAGDLVKGYTNNVEGFRMQLKSWKDSVEPVGSYMPIYEAIGNHESLYTAYDDGSSYGIQFDKQGENSTESIFAEEFVNPRNGPEPERENAPTYKENAYYFDYDNTRIIVINTNYWISTSPEEYGGNLEGFILENQMNWIRSIVEDAESDSSIDHVFPVMHEPPFPNSGHIDDTMWYEGQKDYVLKMRDEMLSIFGESGKVPAVLASDEHNYQRVLINDNTPVYTNMTSTDYGDSFYEIVSGGAGAPKYERAYAPWGSYVKKFKSAEHYVSLSIDGERVSIEAINPSGEVIDEKVISRKEEEPEKEVKFATFNIVDLTTEQVQSKGDPQAEAAAEIIQETNPDVIALNEIVNNLQEGEHTNMTNAKAFVENYLSEPQRSDLEGINYEHIYVDDSNTGIPSGMDIDNNGEIVTEPGSGAYGNDAYGYGEYPGQYAMALLSKYPIKEDQVRTFQEFLWKDMPNNKMPTDPDLGGMYLNSTEQEKFRLSSKSHWDVPINVEGTTVHALVAHPTPPVFDGSANLNGRRNHDEVRLLADYVKGKDYIYDDSGETGGLSEDAKFVVLGDMNAAPDEEENFQAASQLLDNSEINTEVLPMSQGGIDIGPQSRHFTTGARQIDYVLPSTGIDIKGSAVFWPGLGPGSLRLQDVVSETSGASDHRLVWVETDISEEKQEPEPTDETKETNETKDTTDTTEDTNETEDTTTPTEEDTGLPMTWIALGIVLILIIIGLGYRTRK